MNALRTDSLFDGGGFSTLDEAFARFIGRIDGMASPELLVAAARVSRARGEGHICLDLAAPGDDFDESGGQAPALRPDAGRRIAAIAASPAVGRPGDRLPLILDGTRLYLFRYWEYERTLVDALKTMTADDGDAPDDARLKECFETVFPPGGRGGGPPPDWQRVAAFCAVRHRFCVVSGGPGTGKTFTAARILALLGTLSPGSPPRFALSAPTGKAAARLQEALREARATPALPPALAAILPETASTLHRLLGARPDTPHFRHDAGHPLPADIVVVDEASMVDLALFAKLVRALPPRARLILLGDKDQLASVEAGAVLGDICDTGNRHGYSAAFAASCLRVTGERVPVEDPASPGLNDHICSLERSHRFGEASGIGALSRAVNAGEGRRAADLLAEGKTDDVSWLELPRADVLIPSLEAWLDERDVRPLAAGDPADILARFKRSGILCALREGPYGVRNVNALVERILRAKGRIGPGGAWYAGRPVMVTKNDYGLGLYNGDVGVALEDPDNRGELRVFFPDAGGKVRSVPPLRLPEHETVYAMTVHKSQGSEFDDVLLILPDRDAPVLSRELIYTAVTRARRLLRIAGRKEVLLAAVERRIRRASGLRDALWGGR